MISLSRGRPFWTVASLLVLITGCSTTASIGSWQAGEQQFPGTKRLALLGFQGPVPFTQQARSTLVAELRESRAFDIDDRSDLVPYGPQQAIRQGENLGADAVLVGWVKIDQGGTQLAGSTFSFGDPTLTAKLQIKLINVRTAEVLAERTATHSLKGDFEAGHVGSESVGQVTSQLVKQCTQEILSSLAPYREKVDIQLAGALWGDGASEIRAGNRAAAEGDWDHATDRWQSALRKNPDCAVAKYNLGVAFESQQRFSEARKMYLAASAADNRPLYQKALIRLERNRRDYQLAFGSGPRSGRETQLVRHETLRPHRLGKRFPAHQTDRDEPRRLPPIETPEAF